jgi:hypothetical protein
MWVFAGEFEDFGDEKGPEKRVRRAGFLWGKRGARGRGLAMGQQSAVHETVESDRLWHDAESSWPEGVGREEYRTNGYFSTAEYNRVIFMATIKIALRKKSPRCSKCPWCRLTFLDCCLNSVYNHLMINVTRAHESNSTDFKQQWAYGFAGGGSPVSGRWQG